MSRTSTTWLTFFFNEKRSVMSVLKTSQETDTYLWPLSRFLQTSFNNKVQMEDIDEELKINILNILPSVSEETINGIIHALKYVGLETMSDLQFVQEEDLILVLKPIQRRRLIKAWSEQSIPSIKLSNLPLPTCKWKRKRCVVLLQVYAKYKAELSKPSVEEKHEVWRKIADEVRKRCSALKCNESQCMNKIEELRKTYQELKTQSVMTKGMLILFNEAKNAFETSKNSVISSVKVSNSVSVQNCKWKKKKCLKLLQVYAKYKTEFLCPDVEELTIWKKIADELRKLYTTFNCDDLHLQCRNKIEELKCEYERIKNGDVKDQETAIFLDEARRAFETTGNTVILPDNVSSSSFVQIWNQKKCLKLLQVYAKYKTEFLCPDVEEQIIWKKIADELRELCETVNCDDLQCRNKVEDLKHEYERIKNKDVKDRDTAIFLDEARRVFETTGNPVSLLSEQSSNAPLLNYRKKNRLKKFHCKLLQVYAKHKTEFASPGTEEQKVWEKIAREMRDTYSYDCGESLCRFELSQLKCQYEDFWKKENRKSGNLPYYFDEARKAFGTSDNLNNSNCQVNEIKKKVGIYVPPHLRNGENRQVESTVSSKTENRTFTIKVSNMPENITESNLQNIFRPFGAIAQLHTVKDLSGRCKTCVCASMIQQIFGQMLVFEDSFQFYTSKCAFVNFTKQEDAARAIVAIDGIEHNWKESALKVEWAVPSEII